MKCDRKAIVIPIATVFVLWGLFLYFRHAILMASIPPAILSKNRMIGLHEGIVDIYHSRNLERGVKRLSEERAWYGGWNQMLFVEYSGRLPSRIISYGSDGVPGGVGDAIDLVLEINFENDDVRLNDIKEMEVTP
jgi:hypothetical protein